MLGLREHRRQSQNCAPVDVLTPRARQREPDRTRQADKTVKVQRQEQIQPETFAPNTPNWSRGAYLLFRWSGCVVRGFGITQSGMLVWSTEVVADESSATLVTSH